MCECSFLVCPWNFPSKMWNNQNLNYFPNISLFVVCFSLFSMLENKLIDCILLSICRQFHWMLLSFGFFFSSSLFLCWFPVCIFHLVLQRFEVYWFRVQMNSITIMQRFGLDMTAIAFRYETLASSVIRKQNKKTTNTMLVDKNNQEFVQTENNVNKF